MLQLAADYDRKAVQADALENKEFEKRIVLVRYASE